MEHRYVFLLKPISLLVLFFLLVSSPVKAVESFARQTGQRCASCHITGFSELTPFGRQFKLRGYSLGETNIPISAGAIVSRVSTANEKIGDMTLEDSDRLMIQRLSMYLAGRIGEGSGAFVNYNYNTTEKRGMMEMFDVRTTSSKTINGKELLFGISLNNNPTVSDIYNSTPGFGFPHTSPSEMSVVNPNAKVQLNNALASSVAGISTFASWDDTFYAELGFYKNANGLFSPLSAGIPTDERASIKSGAPYWRLAYERQWGDHSLMVGTYGLIVNRRPNENPSNFTTDKFRDVAFDAQYQYLTDNHRVSSGVTFINEAQTWNASYNPSNVDNGRDQLQNSLKTTKAHVTYFYQQTYGASLGYLDVRGGADQRQFNSMMPTIGSSNGLPGTQALLYELSYIPIQNIRVGLQYLAYQKFNGGKTNYDGLGRNAKDNNSLYLWAWFLY